MKTHFHPGEYGISSFFSPVYLELHRANWGCCGLGSMGAIFYFNFLWPHTPIFILIQPRKHIFISGSCLTNFFTVEFQNGHPLFNFSKSAVFGVWCRKLRLNKIGVMDMSHIMDSGQKRLYTTFPNIFSLLSADPVDLSDIQKKIIFPKKIHDFSIETLL